MTPEIENKLEDCWLGDFENTESLMNALIARPIFWLSADGEDNDIIISSRVRLARNLNNYFFKELESSDNLVTILKTITGAIEQVSSFCRFVSLNINSLSPLEKSLLVERRLISPNFSEDTRPCCVIIGPEELLSLMINEEDHLRIQAMQPALGLKEAWRQICKFDTELSKHIDYAFSEQFGYLTACPTNVGTGLRASLFIHLPALTATGKVQNVIRELGSTEVTMRGFYGEGTRMLGDIHQVSNQLTLGRVEQKIIDRMVSVATELAQREREERHKLMKDDPLQITDRVMRARAILQVAKLMDSRELLQHLSDLRLGTSLGIIEPLDYSILNELVVYTQPAHLQKIYRRTMSSRERDMIRSEYVREKIASLRAHDLHRRRQ
jgi:protein arginine kinase